MLFYLIYISKSSATRSEESLQEILDVSRDWNKEHSITGMLIYVVGEFMTSKKDKLEPVLEGRFIQVLEGTRADVMEIFDSIKTDRRHNGLIILKSGQIAERNFKDWDMGFKRINNDNEEKGSLNLDEWFAESKPEEEENLPLQFLKSFYQAVQTKQ